MKRRLLTILLFVLLGAVANVAALTTPGCATTERTHATDDVRLPVDGVKWEIFASHPDIIDVWRNNGDVLAEVARIPYHPAALIGWRITWGRGWNQRFATLRIISVHETSYVAVVEFLGNPLPDYRDSEGVQMEP